MGLHHVYQSHSVDWWMRAFCCKLWFWAPCAVLTRLAKPCWALSASLVCFLYIVAADTFINFAQMQRYLLDPSCTAIKSCIGSISYQNICIMGLTSLLLTSVFDYILLCECVLFPFPYLWMMPLRVHDSFALFAVPEGLSLPIHTWKERETGVGRRDCLSFCFVFISGCFPYVCIK